MIVFDVHLLVHFLGPAFGVLLLAGMGLSEKWGVYVWVGASLLWEVFDMLCARGILGFSFLDPAGFNFFDFLAGAIGALSAAYLIWRIKKNELKPVWR